METNVQERIRLFRTVRDIPYYVSVGNEQDYSCSTKSEFLKNQLASLGLKSRYGLCRFRWEDFGLPEYILKLPHEDPEYHQFLQVYILERHKHVTVDPTWDSGLRKIFQINDWDGMMSTKLAVPAKKILSVAESQRTIKSINEPQEIENYLQKNRKFLAALNNYFRQIRINS